MFTHQAGEPLSISKQKTALRSSAHKEWPFLTPLDLTMVDSEPQLATMVKDRSGRTKAQVDIDVTAWMKRNHLQPVLSAPLPLTPSTVPSWENEGGAV